MVSFSRVNYGRSLYALFVCGARAAAAQPQPAAGGRDPRVAQQPFPQFPARRARCL